MPRAQVWPTPSGSITRGSPWASRANQRCGCWFMTPATAKATQIRGKTSSEAQSRGGPGWCPDRLVPAVRGGGAAPAQPHPRPGHGLGTLYSERDTALDNFPPSPQFPSNLVRKWAVLPILRIHPRDTGLPKSF